MMVNKILLILSLLYAQEIITADPLYKLANSLDKTRNVSADFPSNVNVPSTYQPPLTDIIYWTTTSTEITQQTTARPVYPIPQYTPPMTTSYIPPCWTQTTPQITHESTTSSPWYTSTTPPPTTTYIPPCWIQTTPSPVIPSSRNTESPGLENFSCDKSNQFYSVPNECDTFIECKHNVARKQFCPEGLVYKPSTIWPAYPCVLPSEYQCLNGSVIQPADPNGDCPHQDGYFSVPNSDCSQYIVCENGIASLMNCPAGLVFNEIKSICDWPIHVPSCYPDALKDISCPIVDDTEKDKINMFRYQNSCNNYVACQNGFPRLLSCPGELRFDLDKQKCVDASYVTDCDS